MRRYQNLIQYHLQSALQLAREDRHVMVEYLTNMAMIENDTPEGEQQQ